MSNCMEAGTVDSLGNVYTNYSLLSSILLVFKFVKKSISCRRQSFSQPSESCDTTRADFCGLLYWFRQAAILISTLFVFSRDRRYLRLPLRFKPTQTGTFQGLLVMHTDMDTTLTATLLGICSWPHKMTFSSMTDLPLKDVFYQNCSMQRKHTHDFDIC